MKDPRLIDGTWTLNGQVQAGTQFTHIRLRDLFAMHALQAIVVSPEYRGLNEQESAQAAYSLANAMLKAREEV